MQKLSGTIFKMIRESKNMSLKEVADDDISVAQLSRFERGLSGISMESFYRCLNTMNIRLDEFQYLYNNYTEVSEDIYSARLSELYLERNTIELTKLIQDGEKREEEHPNKKKYKLNTIVARIILFYCTPDKPVSKEDIEFLTDYLFSVDEWGRYELWLFTNSVGLLTIPTIETFAGEMINRTQFYRNLPENRKRILQMLLNVINICIEQDHLQVAMKFLNYIENSKIPETDLYERILIKYYKAMYTYKIGNSAAIEDMKRCLEILKYLDCYGTALQVEDQIYALETDVADL